MRSIVLQSNNQIYFECILNFSFPKIESNDQLSKNEKYSINIFQLFPLWMFTCYTFLELLSLISRGETCRLHNKYIDIYIYDTKRVRE